MANTIAIVPGTNLLVSILNLLIIVALIYFAIWGLNRVAPIGIKTA